MPELNVPPSSHSSATPYQLASWRHHLQEETDAAFLYGILAEIERSPARKEAFQRLSKLETLHVATWRRVLTEHGAPPPAQVRPSLRAHGQAWIARRFGPGLLLKALVHEEGEEVKAYLTLHRQSAAGSGQDAALQLAQESAGHARTLAALDGSNEEPWHKTGSGGWLRNVIYGFNDGLTANFGLVAGVIGATPAGGVERFVILSGMAGLVANALSMGSSGYLAAKSEQEVHEHELQMERDEIKMMPEVEQEELALLYVAKGIPEAQARKLASEVMASPERALEEKAREELGINTGNVSPLREAFTTGIATMIGSFIPLLPFLFLSGAWAIWTSFTISMLAHFAVGSLRSFFTGRGVFRSGIDMFLVGLGVAGVGYLVGKGVEHLLPG